MERRERGRGKVRKGGEREEGKGIREESERKE